MVVKNTILLLLVYAGNNLIANHEKNYKWKQKLNQNWSKWLLPISI